MSKCIFLLFTFFYSLFASITYGQDKPKKVILKEVLSIGSEDEDILYQWAGVTTDLSLNIYVTDSMDYSIKKFNKDGTLLKKVGRRGEGPGEFLAPRLIKYFNGFLYVTDQNKPGIQIFDEELNYRGSIPLRVPVIDFKVLSKSLIAISTFDPNENSKCIYFYDEKGTLKNKVEYSKFDDMSQSTLSMVEFEIDNQNNLYIVYTFQDKIEKFDSKGKKIWTKSLLERKEVKMKKPRAGHFQLPMEVVYKDIEFDNFGNIYILGGSWSKNKSRDIYILDKNGNLLHTVTLPESTHCIHIDKENNLYSRAGMGTVLKKYRIEYPKLI